jgi:phosphomannomutase/phosphoglucomutase
LPRTFATPEIRVECPEEEKFGLVERAAQHFASRYPVNTIDGVRITFPQGWGLLRASNTQPVLVMRFEAVNAKARDEYQAEVEDFLKNQKGVSGTEKNVSSKR